VPGGGGTSPSSIAPPEGQAKHRDTVSSITACFTSCGAGGGGRQGSGLQEAQSLTPASVEAIPGDASYDTTGAPSPGGTKFSRLANCRGGGGWCEWTRSSLQD
jgi:hypothetical protein